MRDKLEGLIKMAYNKWESRRRPSSGAHPDEETLACFLENKLPIEEQRRIEGHIVDCNRCAQIVSAGLSIEDKVVEDVPAELIAMAKELAAGPTESPVLEIILKLKDKALELLATTGDVLVGQELVPAPLLRGRLIKDFKDEVNILKDFKGIRVEAKIENAAGNAFSLTITAKNKQTQKMIKDMRVTLVKGDVELESYQSDTGRVTFEHVLLGRYRVEMTTAQGGLAAVLLDIKV